jgi:hypothetical protein
MSKSGVFLNSKLVEVLVSKFGAKIKSSADGDEALFDELAIEDVVELKME